VGTDKVRDAALAAGLVEEQLESITPSFSLGTSRPSAIRLADAYATFAASGEQAAPYSVTEVEKDGTPQFEYKAEKRQSIDENVANNVTDVLKTVVEKGTGTKAQLPDGRPVAGKTGTTDGNKSAWFAGYTRQLATTIGMWRLDDRAEKPEFLEMYGVGRKDTIHGASFPSEIWRIYMTEAMRGEPVEDFPAARPIGEKIYANGASPSPSPEPSDTVTDTPSASPSKTKNGRPSPSPAPSDTCSIFDPSCKDNSANGGTDGGTTTGSTSSTSPTPTDNNPGNGNSGGFFGGPIGTRRE
jgi:membrane peptidoglycan carboxypeptidase